MTTHKIDDKADGIDLYTGIGPGGDRSPNWYAVGCPNCGAPAGEYCPLYVGGAGRIVHAERREAFAATFGALA